MSAVVWCCLVWSQSLSSLHRKTLSIQWPWPWMEAEIDVLKCNSSVGVVVVSVWRSLSRKNDACTVYWDTTTTLWRCVCHLVPTVFYFSILCESAAHGSSFRCFVHDFRTQPLKPTQSRLSALCLLSLNASFTSQAQPCHMQAPQRCAFYVLFLFFYLDVHGFLGCNRKSCFLRFLLLLFSLFCRGKTI